MLIDELRDRIASRPGSLAWIGCDARYSRIASATHEKEIAGALGEVFDGGVWFDLRPLDSTLASAYGDKPFRFVRDCFAPIPPFVKCGFETGSSGSHNLTLFETISVGGVVPSVRRFHLREEALKRNPDQSPRIHAFQDDSPDSEIVPLIDAAYFVTASFLTEIGDRLVFFDSYAAYFVSKRGELLTMPIVNPLLSPSEVMKGDAIYLPLLQLAIRHFHTATMAQNLLACKNVSHRPRSIERKLQKARQRRGKEPLTEYHEVVVTVPRTRRGSLAPSINESEVEHRIERMRGHFKDYTEGQGLFGKWKGIYWWPERKPESSESVEYRYRLKPGTKTNSTSEKEGSE